MSALSSLVLTGERVNFQIEFAPEQRLDRPPTRGAPAPQHRAARNGALKQAYAAADRTVKEQAARIIELERQLAAYVHCLADTRSANAERAARAESALSDARDQLHEALRLHAADLRTTRESHASELACVRRECSAFAAAESERAAYAASGQITAETALSLATDGHRREENSIVLQHALDTAALRDRAQQCEDFCLRQRTAILERDLFIQKLQEQLNHLKQKSRTIRPARDPPLTAVITPSTPDNACPPGPLTLSVPDAPLLGTLGAPEGLGVHSSSLLGFGDLGLSPELYIPDEAGYVSQARAELAFRGLQFLLAAQQSQPCGAPDLPEPSFLEPLASGDITASPEYPECVSPPGGFFDPPDQASPGPPDQDPGPARIRLQFPIAQPPRAQPTKDSFTYYTLHPSTRRQLLRNRSGTESPDDSEPDHT